MPTDDDRPRVADSLDPRAYVEFVTRTAMMLEQIAKGVEELRKDSGERSKDLDSLRSTVVILERAFAVFKVETEGRVKANEEALRDLNERLRWLNRTVQGVIIGAVISGVIGLVFHFLGQ